MNIAILFKILDALCSVVTVTDPQGNTVAGWALALKQSLEVLIKGNPDAAMQLNQLLAQCACNDWTTFEEIGKFVAACLTQGQSSNVPSATNHFQAFAAKVVK